MSIWAIADIHASRTDPQSGRPIKPMDVFGPGWVDHVERLERAWNELVGADDTVIVAGDIDWALHLQDAMETLERIDTWKGKKVLVRGNHDYWWSSKTTNRVRKALPPSITLLHNNSVQADGFNVCGTKGSPVPGGIDWTPADEKILHREHQRLLMSLEARDPGLPTIVALHFPPFYRSHEESMYRETLERYGVVACVYGHLHGEASAYGPAGLVGGVRYCPVAGDAAGFRPVLVARDTHVVDCSR